RRQILLAGGALLLPASRRAFASTPDDGASLVKQHATPLDDPWMVGHGVRAMGRGFTLGNGRRAVDHLLETVLATLPANDRTVLGFPLEIEVHPNMFLKTMLEAGVPLDHGFTHKGRRRTVQELVEGARALIRPALVASSPNALPWSIIALTRTTPPSRRQWTNAWGESVDLDALVENGLRLLEEASLPVAQAMREGRPETRQAPVHGFTCGGGHMIYALLAAAHAGYPGKDRSRRRMQQQVDLLVFRLGADVDLIERFYRGRGKASADFWFELDAKLKLLGHAEECLAFAALHKVATFTAAQRAQWQTATATLRRLLIDVEARGLEEARRLDHELYRQLVGDTCHARHGLTLT
ncbi:MAG: hypothetical protein ACREF4_12675, partial [Gammaproteobacteria bacterium]